MSQATRATALALFVAGCMFGQGSTSGTLTINKDKFEIKYSAATIVPDEFDKTKTKTRIILSDKPVPEDLLDDEGGLWDLKSKGYHGLEVEITADKANYSLFVISSTLEGSLSTSGTFDGKQLTVFTPKRVEGTLAAAEDKVAGNTLGYNIKFATAVSAPAAQPTAADAAAAAGKDSTKAYLALVAALRAGDKQKIMDMAPPDKRAMIDTPDFPQMLKMIQSMLPADIKVLKATESGDQATLLARGISDGKPQRGKISLNRVNGKWIMASESWKNE